MYRWTLILSKDACKAEQRTIIVYEESYHKAVEKAKSLFPTSKFYIVDWRCEEIFANA